MGTKKPTKETKDPTKFAAADLARERWEKTPDSDRSEHGRKMAAARWKNRTTPRSSTLIKAELVFEINAKDYERVLKKGQKSNVYIPDEGIPPFESAVFALIDDAVLPLEDL